MNNGLEILEEHKPLEKEPFTEIIYKEEEREKLQINREIKRKSFLKLDEAFAVF